MACSARVERTARRVLKAEPAPRENPDPSVQLEKRANWVSPGCRVILEDKDRRAPAGSPGFLEPTARKEPGASLVNQVREVKEVQQVLVGLEEPEDQPGSLVQRALRETTALQAPPVREDLKDHRGQWVSPDRRAPLARLGRTDFLDILVSAARRVSKEKRVHRAREVSSGRRDPLVRPVPLVSEATPDLLALPESRVFQAPPVKREPRAILDLRDPPVRTVRPASVASPESEVYLVPRAPQV